HARAMPDRLPDAARLVPRAAAHTAAPEVHADRVGAGVDARDRLLDPRHAADLHEGALGPLTPALRALHRLRPRDLVAPRAREPVDRRDRRSLELEELLHLRDHLRRLDGL